MEPDEQMRIGQNGQTSTGVPFLTDDDLDRRLSQVENGLQHFEALLPAMAREVAVVRAQLRRAA